MPSRGHGAGRRWAVVGLLVAVLAALPALLAARPAGDRPVPAARLRAAALASAGVAFSGYAQSAGGLSLPVTDRLTSVADLLSDRTSMRVWWRGPADYRVDVVGAAGEDDVHRDRTGTWTWDYEARTATRAAAVPLTLPTAPDLLPSTLGRRLLSEATDGELSRIGGRRVAGRDALGLRMRPAQPASSVRSVDVWIDPASVLPLEVDVAGADAAVPAVRTRFLDLDLRRPGASVTAFVPPPGAWIRQADAGDVVSEAAARTRAAPLPPSLVGLPRRTIAGAPPQIGLYGRGVTLLAVAPVPERMASGLAKALRTAPGSVAGRDGIRAAIGPLGLMLVDPPGGAPYLLTGTVTDAALTTAAAELPGLGRT